MKNLSSAAYFGVLLGLGAMLLPLDAGAQSPLNSTPPNSNPFAHVYAPPAQSSALPPPSGYGAPPVAAGAYPGYPSALPTYSTESVDQNHPLSRGDHLSFRVVEDRDDKVLPITVTDSGEVDIPYIGRVHAVGKSCPQLAAEIKTLLEREYYYHATVQLGLDAVAAPRSMGRVYVTGAVKAEGAVELPMDEPLTASKAIFHVGGFKDFADQKHVRVLRKNGKKGGIIVNVAAVKSGDSNKDIVLQPEDTIYVPEKTFNISF